MRHRQSLLRLRSVASSVKQARAPWHWLAAGGRYRLDARNSQYALTYSIDCGSTHELFCFVEIIVASIPFPVLVPIPGNA